MNQENRKPAADYLDHFGLSADPFTDQHWPLFERGQRREILAELLRHCQLNTTVLAVLGESGVGKSCFRYALCERLEGKDRLCVVDVPLLVDTAQMLLDIAGQFGVPGPISTLSTESPLEAGSWIAATRDWLEQPVEDERLNVVILENAHNLDDTTLNLLLELGDCGEDSRGSFRLVLFGEPTLSPRLAGLEATGRALKTFTIEPLSPADLKSYLRFRLEAASFAGIFPFRREDMQYLWELSRGVPAAVHEPAREILKDLALPPPEPESLGLPLGHIVAITALVAGLLIALFYRSSEPPELPTAAEPSPEQALIAVEPEANVPPVQILGRELLPGGRESARAADTPLPATEESSGEPGLALNRAGHDDSSTSGGTQTVAEAAKLSDMSSDTGSPSSAAELASPPSRNRALSEGESRLLARSPERFTLQISAAVSRASVGEFVRAQPNGDELIVFAARRDGKVLHIVVAGDFASEEQARAAISSLPQEQQGAGPWPRPLQAVQDDIRRYRGL